MLAHLQRAGNLPVQPRLSQVAKKDRNAFVSERQPVFNESLSLPWLISTNPIRQFISGRWTLVLKPPIYFEVNWSGGR